MLQHENKDFQINANNILENPADSYHNKLLTLWQRKHNIAMRPPYKRLKRQKQQIDTAIINQLCNTYAPRSIPRQNSRHLEDHKNLTKNNNFIPPLNLNDISAVTRQKIVNLLADT
jgi:hypothetical protein